MTTLDPIERAIADIAVGKAVIVVDDEDRENEGDLVAAADAVTPELVAFMMSSCRGLICVPMPSSDMDRLVLGDMVSRNTDVRGTAFTVSVDVYDGTTTGISAADRAATISALADPARVAGDFARPGHVFPLRAKAGGVLERVGHTEAAIDLARLAGRRPAGVICEIADADGVMLRLPRLREFADENDLALVSIADLVAYRRRTENLVERVASTRMPTAAGVFTAVGYRTLVDDTEQVALVYGDIGDGEDVLARVHSECLTGDAFGSLRCDCGPQLGSAMAAIAAEGRGVVVYQRGHEGRGIGLLDKLRAYERQDHGRDTVDANVDLGLPVDARDFGLAAQVLTDLGVRSVRLLTHNPRKRDDLEAHGVKVRSLVNLPSAAGADNLTYLRTKRDRMGHLLNLPPTTVEGA